ncbi:MAG: undecaprenyl-diphosphate phosphatase [bacterium]
MAAALKGVLLGLVQGVTEFLPVSSSGHLVIFRTLLGSGTNAFNEIAFLHIATLLAVFVYFRKGLVKLIAGFFGKKSESRRFVLFLFIASIPAGIAGLFFKDIIDSVFSGNSIFISLFFAINSAVLITSDMKKTGSKKLNAFGSFIIGMFQAVSVLPGVSRSGATISAGIFSGLDRKTAVVFSFYMSIPAVLFGNIFFSSFGVSQLTTADILAFAAAFFSGLLAIRILITVVEKANLKFFGFYTLFAALVNLLLI